MHTQGIMFCQLLCLIILCLAHRARSTSVHEVSISVRSIKSIVYRGMQVSIFEHTHMPKRYFFQPLSFLDVSSARLTENSERNMTQLHVDVLLWTDEFIQLVESHFSDQRSVEMLPLTEISLTWSKQAPVWLGDDFNLSYRLLDDWKDGDKPHMRSTFTIFCNRLEECEKLLQRFNKSDESVGHLFDLRYKIQCDNSRNFSMSIRSAHFSQSPAFQQLERFASQRAGDGRVIVSEQTVDELADQVYTAALVELQRDTKQQFMYVDGESRRAVLTDLHRYLRSDPVHSLNKMQWESQVSWPIDRLSFRPDKLSTIFNKLFTPSRPPHHVNLPNSGLLVAARESLPPAEAAKIDAFVRQHSGHQVAGGSHSGKVPGVHVEEVRELARDLGSHVAWDSAQGHFGPPPALTLFRIDLRSVRRRGILIMRDLTVHFKVSEHMDPVHPLPKDTQFQSSLWQRHFADSFCILANQVEPPGMNCRVLSYLLPTKSLQVENPEDASRPRVAFQGGHIGQSHFYQGTSGEFSFSLKICCTKDLRSP